MPEVVFRLSQTRISAERLPSPSRIETHHTLVKRLFPFSFTTKTNKRRRMSRCWPTAGSNSGPLPLRRVSRSDGGGRTRTSAVVSERPTARGLGVARFKFAERHFLILSHFVHTTQPGRLETASLSKRGLSFVFPQGRPLSAARNGRRPVKRVERVHIAFDGSLLAVCFGQSFFPIALPETGRCL